MWLVCCYWCCVQMQAEVEPVATVASRLPDHLRHIFERSLAQHEKATRLKLAMFADPTDVQPPEQVAIHSMDSEQE